MYHKNERIQSLDSLRGLASVVVVIFHCLISFPIFHNANYKDEYVTSVLAVLTMSPLHTLWAGNEAVLLFFILSGFVLSTPFLGNNAPGYCSYAVKRFFRIYVPYIAIMMVSIVIMALLANYQNMTTLSETYNSRWDHPVTGTAVMAYILMINYDTTNVNGVVWTLFHEMRISLIFPLLMLVIAKFEWKRAFAISLGSAIILYYMFGFLSNIFTQGLSSAFIFSVRETIYYTTFFVGGAILAKYIKNVRALLHPLSATIKVGLFCLAILLINFRWINVVYHLDNFMIKDIIAGIGILVLFSLVLSSNTLEKILTKRSFLFLGKVSYSLYLIHIPVIMVSSRYLSEFVPIPMTFVVALFLSIGVAHFTYQYIEVPSISLGKIVSHWLQSSKNTSETSKYINTEGEGA